MGRFSRSFWMMLLMMGGILVAGLHWWWSPRSRALPPPLPFPKLNRVYVSYQGVETTHYLLWFGMFGFEKKIRESDVLLLGTSHPMFGLSAAQMSDRLSAESGRPVRVLNLGSAYAESLGFISEVLRRHEIRKKTLIVDLCLPFGDGYSDNALEIIRSSQLGAYLRVPEVWFSFTRDWLLDGVFPRFKINDKVSEEAGPRHQLISFERFLSFAVECRRWDSNDVSLLWYPVQGIVYDEASGKGISHPVNVGRGLERFPHDGVFLSDVGLEKFRKLDLNPICTLIPYEGGDPNFAAGLARSRGIPFVPIAPDGLAYFDAHHLTPPSKVVATDRLLDGFQALGIRF